MLFFVFVAFVKGLVMNDLGGCWEIWMTTTSRSYPMTEIFLDIRNNQLVNFTNIYVPDSTGQPGMYDFDFDFGIIAGESSFDGARFTFKTHFIVEVSCKFD